MKIILPMHSWGIRTILFNVGSLQIPSYSFFIALGFLVGLAVYLWEAEKSKSLGESNLYIIFGALAGAVVGAKLLDFLVDYKYFIANFWSLETIFYGKTLIGGLMGGVAGSRITKKLFNIRGKKGNLFAPAIAIGVAIGRIGCFLRGCCYGKPTKLPWGVNFGDGVLRYPTQIFESLFMLLMFLYLEKIKNRKDIRPGQLLKILMVSYFIFRFFIEFIRAQDIAFLGLTGFQIISLIAIIYLIRDDLINIYFKIKKTLYGKR
jgi:phosphatidylglycerol:prolipoprotein diacylglycerol transferase